MGISLKAAGFGIVGDTTLVHMIRVEIWSVLENTL